MSDVKTTQRDISIDAVRGFAVIGVVFIHNRFFGQGGEEYSFYADSFGLIFDWSVVAFFFLSGLLLKRDLRFGRATARSFLRLCIPFVALNVFYNTSFVLLSVVGVFPSSGSERAPLWQWPVISPAFQLYFLPYLLACLTTVRLLLIMSSGRKNAVEDRLLFVLVIMIVAYYLYVGFPPQGHGPHFQLLPFYIAATAFGALVQLRVNNIRVLWVSALCVAMIVAASFVFHENVPPTCFTLFVPYFLVVIFGSSWCVRPARWLAMLGPYAGGVYLWHTPLLMPAVNIALLRFGLSGAFLFMGTAVVALGVSLAVTAFFHFLLPRHLRYIVLTGR